MYSKLNICERKQIAFYHNENGVTYKYHLIAWHSRWENITLLKGVGPEQFYMVQENKLLVKNPDTQKKSSPWGIDG